MRKKGKLPYWEKKAPAKGERTLLNEGTITWHNEPHATLIGIYEW